MRLARTSSPQHRSGRPDMACIALPEPDRAIRRHAPSLPATRRRDLPVDGRSVPMLRRRTIMLRTNHHDSPEPTTRATRHALDQRQSSQLDTSHPQTEGATPAPTDAAGPKVKIPQYRHRAIPAVWAAAALPMAALAWLVAPVAQIGSRARATCRW